MAATSLLLTLLLSLLAACDARSSVNRGSQPVLRALRGGATSGGSLLWVRAPEDADGKPAPLQLVRSLGAFCEEHELDEEAMLAVSRGEADDHDGWQCGEAQQYDAPAAAAADDEEEVEVAEAEDAPVKKVAKAKAKAKVAKAVAEDDDEEEEAEKAEAEEEEGDEGDALKAAMPTAMQRNKMIVGLVAPMLTLQAIKRFDNNAPEFLPRLRGAFFAIIAFNTLIQVRASAA